MGSKGKGGRMRFQPGGGAPIKQAQLQAQKLQEQMMQAQQELEQATVTVSVGGAVTAVMDREKLVSLRIDPAALDPDDVELLQDMVVSAVNQSLQQLRQLEAQKMEPFTRLLGMSGLM
jgi:DNA-binding YbaB/EbfC family protein